MGSRLNSYWNRTWASLGQPAPDLAPLLARYAEPHRHYHNAAHLLDCLEQFERFAAAVSTVPSPLVPLALFYHDAIYDPRAKDNEERSAEFAARDLRRNPSRDDIVRLIRITDHRTAPTRDDECLIVDIDLSILGRPAAVFADYERAIRREYAHVPEDAFRAGRAAILRRILARRRIYHLPFFFQQYEAAARVNLTSSLAQLAPP